MIAVITAGGTIDPAFASTTGTNVKALVPWRGMRLIDPAIHAARACGIASLSVVGRPQVEAYCGSRIDKLVAAVDSGEENLQRALQCGHPDQPLLLLTSDLPFLTPGTLEHFLAHVGDCEVAMPLADGAAYMRAYPGAAKHVTTLGDECVANGSIFYFSSGTVARRSIAVAKRLFGARKSLLKLASLLDLGLIARFATRRLTVADIEAFARRRLGLHARAVRNASPALCYDIDTIEDYRYAVERVDTDAPG